MNDLKARLRRAIAEGFALATLGVAGCSGPVIPSRDAGNSLADGGSEEVLDGGVADSGVPNPGPTYPLDLLVCHGPDYMSGYHGRCCAKASCYTPVTGGCSPTAPAEIGLPPGSGSCLCAVADGSVLQTIGPFAPNPNHTPQKAGSCCYVFGSILCDGRPLIVDGQVVTAEVIHRSDWA